MPSVFRILLAATFMVCMASSSSANPPTLPDAQPPYYRVRYEPSTQPGELVYGVSYTIWLPPGVKTLKGIIVHQHGCGEGACKAGQTAAFDLHWQALATKHACALLGPSYEQPEKANCSLWCDPRHGSGKKYLEALTELARQTGHAELATVPWALWGHSGGAHWAGTMLMLHPEKSIAVWLRSGTPRLASDQPDKPALEIPPAAYTVPVMCNLGTKEGVTETTGRFARVWESTKGFFTGFRSKGGLIGVAVDPKSSHDCGNSRYLAIPWLDACLTARLPAQAGAPLQPMPTDPAWLAPLLGTSAEPASKFTGDAATSVWLPNERLAKAWGEYVKDGEVTDSTPPPAPALVQINATGELTWNAEADLESGIAGFVIERDGVELARIPSKPVGSIGRKIFQNNNYSDTPTQPLPQMRFTDPAPKAGAVYTVATVNSVGAKSEIRKAIQP